MKKQAFGFLAGVIATAVFMSLAFPAVAATIEAAFNSVSILIDGKKQASINESFILPNGQEVPYSINYKGTTYLPLRKLAEAVGIEVVWDAKSSTVELIDGNVRKLLDIPTYDGNLSTGHPSVVYVQGGWNGYLYWMADTPYPDEARENPSVYASNDGINWVVPQGAPNPVVTQSEMQDDGYGHGSDTNLVMLPNNQLALYYRASAGNLEAIYRLTSSDGKTWGNKHRCIHVEQGGSAIMSPAVVYDNGTYYMYTVNIVDWVYKIQRRTSADGLTWGEPVYITQPLDAAWHIDVNLKDGKYRMLATVHGEWEINYLVSSDGLNWTQPYSHPVFKRSGEDFDINGYYKAAMIPVPGQPLKFDIWLTCLSSSQENVYHPSCVWRTMYLKNVDLEQGSIETSRLNG